MNPLGDTVKNPEPEPASSTVAPVERHGAPSKNPASLVVKCSTVFARISGLGAPTL